MSRPLLALLLLLLPLSASAKPRKRVAVVPKTAGAEKQAFEQNYMLVFEQAGQSFLKDEGMPDPAILEPLLEGLKEPGLSSAAVAVRRLEELIGNAEYVQGGPSTISTDVYKLMVGQVAQSLAVGVIVERNFVPNNRAGRSLDASEKSLVTACQGEARNQAYDRRGYYQFCLGRRAAEAVYLDPARVAANSGPMAASPAGVRVLAAIAADRSRFAPTLSEDLGRKMADMRTRLGSGMPLIDLNGDAVAPVPWSNTGGIGRSLQRRAADAAGRSSPDFTQAKGLKTSEPPLNSADLAAGTKLAQIAVRDEIGFTGYCYAYVKSALQKAGIVDRKNIDAAGSGAHAKLFAAFVDKNPGLVNRKLLRIPVPAWPLPIGAIVVWSPNACGYSAKSGHIEIITRVNPPQACSDGCGTFQVACLEELGTVPAKAAAMLPAAQKELSEAQAAYDAANTGRDTPSRRKAAAVLAKKKAAVKAIQAKMTPRVAAYIIERPGQKMPGVP
ncbi:MAG: hypothetical protein A2X36_09235 [Elusimicrobia bacterium GWA2_69_24]|nr:MAG: hypothetical protein A2X36_09235 [Elusimicrobia bacterium GWA2_69_24]